jgi:chemotaxis protein CheX
MEGMEAALSDITHQIFDLMLRLEVTRSASAELAQAAVETRPSLAGVVHIEGAWNGSVSFECSAELARQAASIMFGLPLEETQAEHVREVVGEMANMAGGNVKTLVPEPSRLSVPTVLDGLAEVPSHCGSKQLVSAEFACRGEPIRVRLFARGA